MRWRAVLNWLQLIVKQKWYCNCHIKAPDIAGEKTSICHNLFSLRKKRWLRKCYLAQNSESEAEIQSSFIFLDAFTLANRPLGALKKLNYSFLPGSRLRIYFPRNVPEKYCLFWTKSFSQVCSATVKTENVSLTCGQDALHVQQCGRGIPDSSKAGGLPLCFPMPPFLKELSPLLENFLMWKQGSRKLQRWLSRPSDYRWNA